MMMTLKMMRIKKMTMKMQMRKTATEVVFTGGVHLLALVCFGNSLCKVICSGC